MFPSLWSWTSIRSAALGLALLSTGVAWAGEPSLPVDPFKPEVMLRVISDVGRASRDGQHQGSSEWGVDLMLSANHLQRYGLRVTSLDIDTPGKRMKYICTGVMIEMVAFGGFRMEMGTVGFVGRGDNSGSNPFGLASFLGYEKRLGRLNLSVGYDSKTIFSKPAITIHSLGMGVGVHF